MIQKDSVYNLMIIEDKMSDVYHLYDLLEEAKAKFDIIHFDTLEEARLHMDTQKVDVVLVDISIPDSYGMYTFEDLFDKYYHIPFIVLTELQDEVFALDAVKKGAQDFLIKAELTTALLGKTIFYSIQRKLSKEIALSSIIEAEDNIKERIARDIHDSLGQNLTSTALNLQNLRSKLIGLDEKYLKYLDSSIKSNNIAIQETRGIARSLMPHTVKDFGLEVAMESLLSILGSASSIDIQFQSNLGNKRFNNNVELVYYRIFQEALNNILKHSAAKNAFIELEYVFSELQLRIIDEGKGFDMDKSQQIRGVGFESMKNRARSIAANLIVFSIPGEGTNITVSLNTEEK